MLVFGMVRSRYLAFQTLCFSTRLFILVFTLVTPQMLLGSEEQREESQFWVTKTALSNQIEMPFLFSGQPVSPEHPRWDDYSDAIATFSTTQDCLLPSANVEDEVNLLAVNWSALRSHRALEVCFFRIFSSIGDLQKIRKWLTLYQYRLLNTRFEKIGANYRLGEVIPSKTTASFEGFVATDVFEDRTNIFRYGIGWLRSAKGYTIQVKLSEYGEVLDVFSGVQGR